MQGIILAAIIAILIGIVIGYLLGQPRISKLNSALQESQDRYAALEQDHERRLREATQWLQQDYEAQLAEKIERYQDQLEERIEAVEKEYNGRLAVATQGQKQQSGGIPAASQGANDVFSGGQPLKQQYELRLKEAARKIQQTYEQHLREKLRQHKADLQQQYETRLAHKIEHYEGQLSQRLAQLEEEYQLRTGVATPSFQTGQLAVEDFPNSPSAGVATAQAAGLEEQLREEYEQKLAEKIEHYQEELSRRLGELEAEYEARLQVRSLNVAPTEDITSEIEDRLKAQYEAKIAEKIEHYQDDLSRRVEDIRQEYETRFQVLQSQGLAEELSPFDSSTVQNASAFAPDFSEGQDPSAPQLEGDNSSAEAFSVRQDDLDVNALDLEGSIADDSFGSEEVNPFSVTDEGLNFSQDIADADMEAALADLSNVPEARVNPARDQVNPDAVNQEHETSGLSLEEVLSIDARRHSENVASFREDNDDFNLDDLLFEEFEKDQNSDNP